MAQDEDEPDDHGYPSEDEVRAALRSLRDGKEADLHDVMKLVIASQGYAIRLVPQEAIDAVYAKYAMDRDLANGGLDQVAWNHGPERTRMYAAAFRAVGAIENAELLDRLATAVADYHATHPDLSDDVVRHFGAYRKSQGGPSFQIPEPGDELAEPLVEFVVERAASLPDPDGELPKKSR